MEEAMEVEVAERSPRALSSVSSDLSMIRSAAITYENLSFICSLTEREAS